MCYVTRKRICALLEKREKNALLETFELPYFIGHLTELPIGFAFVSCCRWSSINF